MSVTGGRVQRTSLRLLGLGEAAALAKKEREANVEHLEQLTDKLRQGLHEHINYIHENSYPENSLPGTLNISFEYIEGESLILRLDMEGICVSTGSACTSGSMEPSHVLAALGLPPPIGARHRPVFAR